MLLRVDPAFDRSVVLFKDIVQVLNWPVAAAFSQYSILL
jgi:hypothetical protein